MIKENVKITYSPQIKVTRICDGCGKEDIVKLSSIYYSRKYRKRKLDLCKSCSTKNEFLDKPKKKGYVGRKQPRNEDSPRWKGGIDKRTGYRKRSNSDGKSMWEHRLVMSEALGRELTSTEIVHHINLDKLNNSLDNLYLFPSRREHLISHDSLRKCGIQFLNSKIWYCAEEKAYVLRPILHCVGFVDISDLLKEKRYKKTDSRSGITYEFLSIRVGPNNWIWKRFHVAVAERMIGRLLNRNERVHHINLDKLSNGIRNLDVMTNSEHSKCHYSLGKCALELYKQGLVGFNREIGKYFVVDK